MRFRKSKLSILAAVSIHLAPVYLFSCAPGQATVERRAQLHLQIGTALLGKGNYPGALQELLIAEQLDPENPAIQNNLGLAFFVRQKYPEAEQHIQMALVKAPHYTDARNNLGRLYIEMGNYNQAIVVLKRANEDLTYPFPDKTLTNLGIAYFNKGEFAVARDYLKKSLGIKRENCLTFNFYGRALFELSDFQLAAESFDQAIALCKSSKFDEPHYFSALSYYKTGDKSRAVARLEELIALFPEGKYSSQSKNMLQMIR
jgi:type IV pilus assembly protein PilF